MTRSEADKMIRNVGGLQEVNKEAQLVFELFGTNEMFLLKAQNQSLLASYSQMTKHPEVKDFPALFALGDTVVSLAGTSNFVPRIIIRFGEHRHARNIYIFQSDIDKPGIIYFSTLSHFEKDPEYIEISSNIFVMK
jgi:hypothetical protein